MAEVSHDKRSTRNRGTMSEETYHFLCEVLKGNPKNDPDVKNFEKSNLSFIYENSCKSKPKFSYQNDTLLRTEGESCKIVVHEQLARTIISNIHKPEGKACRPGGVRKVVEKFQSEYYLKDCDQVVRTVLSECTGMCKRLKALKTRKQTTTKAHKNIFTHGES